jgi:hypothetical protein
MRPVWVLPLFVVALFSVLFAYTYTVNKNATNGENDGVMIATPVASIAATASSSPAAADISVSSPSANSIVKSPLTITGKARGNWFFEAQFPVVLLDANGKELSRGVAQATEDWMTTDFVDFKVTLTFSQPTTATGEFVLSKDNPSGLPENDASVRVPVKFR